MINTAKGKKTLIGSVLMEKERMTKVLTVDDEFRFDRWLRNELYKRDMTQKEFAEKADITCTTVSYYINNKEMPTVRTLALMLKALDMHMEFVENK